MKKKKLSSSVITLSFICAVLVLSNATVNAQIKPVDPQAASADTSGGSGTGCKPKGSLCLNRTSYMLKDSVGGNGTGGVPKTIMVNNYTFKCVMKDKKYSEDFSTAKTLNLNGQTFELQEYDKNAKQLFEAEWLIIDNKLYKKKNIK